MKTIIKRKLSFSNNDNLILICNKKNKLSKFKLQDNELKFINKEWKKNEEIILKVIFDLSLIGRFSYQFKIN